MSNETALITGASSGIGLELARLFAADGSHLVLVARREEALRKLAVELVEKHRVEVRVVAKDLAKPGAAAEVHAEVADGGTEVDVLVNNAGFGSVGPFAELPFERQSAMVQLNVTALTELARLFLPAILERERGGILNVGSTAGFQPGPNMAVYYATKAFVLSFTEALAEEVGQRGVSISCLAPGATHTGFGADSGMESSVLFQKFGAMDAPTVAKAGYDGFRRGKVLVIPGLKNKLTAFSVRLAPRTITRKVVKWLQS